MKPWADLSSGERLDAIMLAVDAIQRKRTPWRDATASAIAIVIEREHAMERPHFRKRQMSTSVRVTPGITALRNRGLITYRERLSGDSGGCDVLTDAGERRVAELREIRRLGGMDAIGERRARGLEDDGSHGAY